MYINKWCCIIIPQIIINSIGLKWTAIATVHMERISFSSPPVSSALLPSWTSEDQWVRSSPPGRSCCQKSEACSTKVTQPWNREQPSALCQASYTLSYWRRLCLISAVLLPFCENGAVPTWVWMILLVRVIEIRAGSEQHLCMRKYWYAGMAVRCYLCMRPATVGELNCKSGGWGVGGGARLTSLSVVKREVIGDWGCEELLLRTEEDKVTCAFLEMMNMIGAKQQLNHKNHMNVDVAVVTRPWVSHAVHNHTVAWQYVGSGVSESKPNLCCNNA